MRLKNMLLFNCAKVEQQMLLFLTEMHSIFKQVNLDCSKTGESVVPFSDIDYYTEQIMNIYDYPYAIAYSLAFALSKIEEA